MVDQNGNAATYTYDAVGNLLSIANVNADTDPRPVVVTLPSSTAGKPGTVLTLYGKGFSPTPGLNTVTFNGTPATVTSAAPNRITVTVPASATTGTIHVVTPQGSVDVPGSFMTGTLLAVSPSSVTLYAAKTQQFTAAIDGVATGSVTWAVNGITGGHSRIGTISSTGLYTPPALLTADMNLTVTATVQADRTWKATATVTLIRSTEPTAAVSVALASSLIVDRSIVGQLSVAVGSPATTFLGAPVVTVGIQPFITGLSPASAAVGTTNLTLTVFGSGLNGTNVVTFLRNNVADSNITAVNPTVNGDGTQMTVTISIASGTATGSRVVRVTVPGGTSSAAGTGGNVFTVQ